MTTATVNTVDEPMSATATRPAFHPDHLLYLVQRGIATTTIEANGLHSARPQDLPRLCGRPTPDGVSGLVIPYEGCDGFARVRLFPPIATSDGHEQKFGQPAGSPVRLYVPAGVRGILSDPERTIFIIEGEVKAIALMQAGLPTVALGGIWNFRGKDLPDDALIPDLEVVPWSGRIVYLVSDSDAWTNEQVLHAVFRFARLLEARGATVLVVKFPTLDGQEKTGADDFLVAKGPAAFRRLVEKAAVTLGHPAFKPWREQEKARARQAHQDAAEERDPLVADTEPWPEPVDGGELLDEIVSTLRRFLALPAHTDVAVALWAVASHAMDAFEVFPLLAATSPTKRCGKTTLLSMLGRLLRRALPASNITTAALFRAIEQYHPSLLIDEVDTFLNGNDELRGVINSGHSKATAFVLRVEGEGDDRRVVPFSTWCPRALAQIGTPPATIEDRAIVVPMRRRMKDERVERARARALGTLGDLARKITRWAADHLDHLALADPHLPDDLDDRASDNWIPLVAVADLAGGPWPDRARKAAVVLSAGRDAQDDELGTRLLRNIRQVFDDKVTDRLSSMDLVAGLTADPEWGWNTLWKGRGLDQRKLARLLAPFHIGPRVVRIGEQTARGYAKDQFIDAWSRYLAPGTVTSVTSECSRDLDHFSERNIDPHVTDRKPDLTTEKHDDVTDVTDKKPPKGQEEALFGPNGEWEEV